MTEMLAFARRSAEYINAMLARYEVVRQRAANEGHFVMSIEGCALQILRAAGIHAGQLTTLLHQFGGRLPVNEQEYQTMITQVRRQGHIQEHTPGNIATILQGPFRQARPGAYYAEPENMQTQHQQLQSYWSEWSDPEHQWPLAQQPVAAWASPSSGSQWAEAGGASWTSGSQWAEAGTDTWYPTQPESRTSIRNNKRRPTQVPLRPTAEPNSSQSQLSEGCRLPTQPITSICR